MKTREHFQTEEEFIEYLKQPKRFFSYDGSGGFEFHLTLEEAKAEAEKCFEYESDNAYDFGWNDGVTDLCYGEIKGEVFEASPRIRKSDFNLDEDGYDEEAGYQWENNDFDEIIDYKLREICRT